MKSLETLDYAIFVVYLILMGGVGVFFGWFVKDVAGYFKGGSSIPWPVAGISNYMGMFSTFIFVAYAGVAYEHGLVALTVIWCTVLPCVLAAVVFAHRWRRAGLTTPVEYLETRFSLPVRQVFSWTGLLMRFLDNIVRMYAIGVFLAAVTPLDIASSVIISGLVITLYTVIGGLWAVTVMDTIQFVVLLLASVILFPLSLQAVGGFAGIAQSSPEHLHWFNGPKGAPLWLIVYYIMIVLKYNANWAFVQRLYSVRDESASRKVAWLSTVLFLVTPPLFILPPLAAKILLPELADKEMAYEGMAVQLLPAGMMGLMLAAMFSATMSSLNSEFNVMAGVLTKDVYQRLFVQDASNRHLVHVGRAATVSVGFLITGGALSIQGFGGAFEANKLFTGIIAIPLAIPFLLGLLLAKPGPWGAALAVVGGAITAFLLNTATDLPWEVATLLVIALCTIVFVGSALFRRRDPQREAEVERFFLKLKTPIGEAEKPVADPTFKKALTYLFAGSFVAVGLMFLGTSLISIGQSSGKIGAIAGAACCGVGLLLWMWFQTVVRRQMPKGCS
jgi:SSS family transporter